MIVLYSMLSERNPVHTYKYIYIYIYMDLISNSTFSNNIQHLGTDEWSIIHATLFDSLNIFFMTLVIEKNHDLLLTPGLDHRTNYALKSICVATKRIYEHWKNLWFSIFSNKKLSDYTLVIAKNLLGRILSTLLDYPNSFFVVQIFIFDNYPNCSRTALNGVSLFHS